MVCYRCDSKTQIKVAAILSSIFGVIMIGIIVGSIARIVNSSPISPSSLVLYSLIIIFLIAGILHPREFKCLIPGLLYFISLPSAFILLNIYSLTNLNNISWGTREIAKTQTENGTTHFIEHETQGVLAKYYAKLFGSAKRMNQDFALNSIFAKLEQIDQHLVGLSSKKAEHLENDEEKVKLTPTEQTIENKPSKKVDWIEHECLQESKLDSLNDTETKFFNSLISKYLYPLNEPKSKQEQIASDLKLLRDKCCFLFFMLNSLWIMLLFALQLLKEKLRDKIYFSITLDAEFPSKYEPVSFLFVMLFVVVLFVQFFGMLYHRAITFMQLVRKTSLKGSPSRKVGANSSSISSSSNGRLNQNENLGFDMNDELHNEKAVDCPGKDSNSDVILAV